MVNILVTGFPRIGKTTLIKELLKKTTKKYAGFYTEEIKNQNERRSGFKVVALSSNEEGILAHVNTKSNMRVGKYGVDLKDFESIIIPEMEKDSELLVIDEIGKMELFSKKFKDQLLKCLEKGNVIATITKKGGGMFVENIKNREDVELIMLTIENRNLMVDELLKKIDA
ncbi:MAG: NTPase [Candidatus Heimdallarchaeota archaeon]